MGFQESAVGINCVSSGALVLVAAVCRGGNALEVNPRIVANVAADVLVMQIRTNICRTALWQESYRIVQMASQREICITVNTMNDHNEQLMADIGSILICVQQVRF